MGHHASERVESARDVTATTFGAFRPIGPASADAALVALGEELEAAWAAEIAAYAQHRGDLSLAHEAITDAAHKASKAIILRIEAMAASTIDGLRVKARAVQWCYDGDPVDLVVDQSTTDLRLANSIIADLLAVPPAAGAPPVAPDPMPTLIEPKGC